MYLFFMKVLIRDIDMFLIFNFIYLDKSLIAF